MMKRKQGSIFLLYFLSLFAFAVGCKSKTTEQPVAPVFEVLDEARTGLHFTNHVVSSAQFNLFKYMYFYNGAGVGAGDLNNDGLIDLFFSSNQGENKLYLNSGNLQFKDVTSSAAVPQDGGWSTGVSIIDINNDGLLDIYICKVGKYQILNSHNQLLICQGIGKNGVPTYADKASEYGLDFSGFSTQAAFLDYDMDGDLDMFLLNHSIHQNGTFAPRSTFLGTYNEVSGDRIYRNDGGNKFTNVTRESGINSSAISYGLGITVADINLDGYPDIYIGNDFHENDYLYINQRNGTFKEELTERIMHTSQFSMGVDVADINNDALPEIVSMDMLASDPYILKRSLGEDAYDIYNLKIGYGYNNQYTRNNLQLNRGNGMFSEIGLYSGISATDWSWSSLWMDFDNDGLKDLFISNGIPKRMNDIDYINYISSDMVQNMINVNTQDESYLKLIDKFPQIKIPNKFFSNKGDLKFNDIGNEIKGDRPNYSNGAIYADLDNDGDLDIVVNNIDDPAQLYENKSHDQKKDAFTQLTLKGPASNIHSLGAKVFIFANGGIRSYEKYPVRGFQSSMEEPLHIGLANSKIDSAFLVWPDNTFQPLKGLADSQRVIISYQKGLPLFDYNKITSFNSNSTLPMKNITDAVNLKWRHKENPFVEFDREALIPHMVSTEGPALAVADINHDSLDDIFIGSSKGEKSSVFLQQPSGKFYKTEQPDLDNDSTYEDVDASWIDINNDGNVDLVIASGGNEYYGTDKFLLPRAYLNNGKGIFTKIQDAFENMFVTASSVAPYDFNGDGYVDLFVGARAVPYEYGQIPKSYLLENDQHGRFRDVTSKYAPGLQEVGFVTQSLWFDIDKDGDKDLILSLEWDGISAFINNKGSFTKQFLTTKKGWWNFVLPCDIDNDGDIDLVAGNLGLNSRLQASEKEPVKLYFNDFDGNGKKEQVLTYFKSGKEIPFASKAELDKQMPVMKKRYLYAADFAKATLSELFTPEMLQSSSLLTADYFSNAILINQGNLKFEVKALPWMGQLAPYKDAVVINANNDDLPDILLVGNYYENNIEMGRYDADYGTVLVNKGKGNFTCEGINGLQIKGQVRHIKNIHIGKENAYVLVRNNDSAMVITQKR